MTFSLLISPHLSIPVFSQNDGSNCGKEIILPPAAELCNNNDYKMEKEAMWFEFTANATSHELIVSYSETPPLAEITKLQLFENKCPELHLRKEVTAQPPELPRMLADQLIVGEKYKVRAERVPGFETGNFKMCITREEVGGGGGPSDKHSGHCAPAATPWKNPTATTFLSLCSDYTRVGIGKDNPHHSLDVHGHIGLENHLIFNSTSTHGVINWPGNGSLWFRTNATAGDISDNITRMIITGDGKVGIGSNAPGYKLTLKGEYGSPQMLIGYNGNNGIFFHAQGGSTHYNWMISQQKNVSGLEFIPSTAKGGSTFSSPVMVILSNGDVGIGTSDPQGYKLSVKGTIKACEVLVPATGCDFVFGVDYRLQTLEEVELFVKNHQHLPGIASAKEMQTNGVNISEFQMQLLQKVEELYLYSIQQDKTIMKLRSDIENLKIIVNKE